MAIKHRKYIEDAPNETIVIGAWNSVCNNCGFPALPSDGKHIKNVGYDEDIRNQPACGIEWKYAIAEYYGGEEVITEQWPEYEIIDWPGFPTQFRG